jgi:hypothetical protein
MPARRNAASFVKCFAERSLAYLEGTAQGRNGQRLVDMCERQSLRLFDEITVRITFPAEGRFRHDFEPLTNVHQNPR